MFRLAVAAIALSAVPAIAAETPATGANVRSAAYAQGSYRETGVRTWGEFDKAGKQTNAFVEEARNAMDEWIKAYQTQCADAKVDYQGTGSGAGIVTTKPGIPRQPEASFRSSSGFWNNSPVRYGVGAAGGDLAGTFRGVEGGAIAGQGDADRRCPEAARAVNGTWTGQWHQAQGPYPGLCMIRFEHR